MAHINIAKDGTFPPLPREKWGDERLLYKCLECGEKSAVYRITHDDFPCFNCGQAYPKKRQA